MRSTIVIFVIVFALLGLLLGFSESYDAPASAILLKGTSYQLTVTNNSDQPCTSGSQGNESDCYFLFQESPDDGN
jgi:hypothetical protein